MITPSFLRSNVYNYLDQVINTGIPIVVNRNGKVLKIILEQPVEKTTNLKKREVLNCKPEEIINNKWESEWKV